ncbi:MAG: flagellar hook-associated protein FlgL [bacterium]
MRITNNIVLRNAVAGLADNRNAVQKLQTQIQSGSKIQAASDDPTIAQEAMGSSSGLLAIDQYTRNIDAAKSRNSTEDSALTQVTDLLARAKELMVSQNTDTATAATRSVASKEMEQIFNQVVSIGNTQLSGSYVFGGDAATTTPFLSTGTGGTLDFTSSNPTGTRSISVSAGQNLIPTHDGKQIFIDSNVLTSLRDASKALATNDLVAGTASMGALDGAFQKVQELLGETGARANTLDIATQNLSALKINLTTFRSNALDIDVEATVTALVTKQTAYQAAMMATSKVIGMSLSDYLR